MFYKVFSIAIIVKSKKGHNFAIHGPTEKTIRVCLLFVLMLHIKFQGSTQIDFHDTVATYFSQKGNNSGNI